MLIGNKKRLGPVVQKIGNTKRKNRLNMMPGWQIIWLKNKRQKIGAETIINE